MAKRKPGGKHDKGKVTAARVQRNEERPVLPDVERKAEVDESPWDAEGLTPRQRLFVEALIGPAGGNASKAAEIAGYRADNRDSLYATASRTLSYVKVREAIARRLARANLTADWLKEITAALAGSNMGSFLSLGADGRPTIDWQQAERMGAFVQIKKYKEKGFETGGTAAAAGTPVIIERSIETHGPAPYLQLLARLLGLVGDDVTNITVNAPVKVLRGVSMEEI